MGSKDLLQDQLSNYLHFVEKNLKPRLSDAELDASIVQAEIKNYEELGTRMKDMIAARKPGESIESLVDLGHKAIFCNAIVNNSKRIFVKLGMGFHVELTPEEASKFAKKRISFLKENKLKETESEIKTIKGHIESASMMLDQLHAEIGRS